MIRGNFLISFLFFLVSCGGELVPDPYIEDTYLPISTESYKDVMRVPEEFKLTLNDAIDTGENFSDLTPKDIPKCN